MSKDNIVKIITVVIENIPPLITAIVTYLLMPWTCIEVFYPLYTLIITYERENKMVYVITFTLLVIYWYQIKNKKGDNNERNDK